MAVQNDTPDASKTTAEVLSSTLKNHPVISLVTTAFVIVVTSVGCTYAILNILLIQPLATKVDKTHAETANTDSFLGTPIHVRETIDNKQSIVVLEGRMIEGETALSIDGNIVLGITAIDGELITIGGFFLESHNPFRIQLKSGMSIITDSTPSIGLHDYSISVKEISERSAYVVCRCLIQATIHSNSD